MRSDQEFVRYVKKSSFGVFLGAKSKGLLLQKQANRTVHLSKIEEALPQDYVLPNDPQGDTFCLVKAYSGGFKLYHKSLLFGTWCQLLILDSLGVVWGANLDPFWHA